MFFSIKNNNLSYDIFDLMSVADKLIRGKTMTKRLYLNTVFLFVKVLKKKKPYLTYLEIYYITLDFLDRYWANELPKVHEYIAGIVHEIIFEKCTIEQLLNMFEGVIYE